jgi:hypothetical protein
MQKNGPCASRKPICFWSMMARGGRELRPQGANFNRITLITLSDIRESDFVLLVKHLFKVILSITPLENTKARRLLSKRGEV